MDAPEVPARYQVTEVLGRGGFGVVLRARDRKLERDVAIKVLFLRPEGEAWERFEREARVLASLEDPHILRLYEHGVAGQNPYLVTELLEGRSLDQRAPADPLEVMLEVAQGLQCIHDAGLVHRDVKPANILRTDQGRTVLLDLGLVTGEGMEVLTATGMVVGTPAYMAPELLRGEAATPATDWFAWGMTLEKLLDRAELSRGRTLAAACQAPAPEDRPKGLGALRAMASDSPTKVVRATAGPVGPRLSSSSLDLPAPPRRRRAWVGAGVGLLAVLAVAWWAGTGPAPPPPPPSGAAPAEAPRPRVFPGDLHASLRDELDAALQVDVVVPAGPGRTRSMRFLDAASLRGVDVLEQLPTHQEVLNWVVEGGDLADLHPDEVDALRRHDGALRDLRLPPAFAPFLDASPTAPGPDPALETTWVRRLQALPVEGLPEDVRPWARAAAGHFQRAEIERDRIVETTSHFAPRNAPANLFAEHEEDPGALDVIRLRSTARGRDTLRDLVQAGEAEARAFLLAVRRVLDAVPPEETGAFHDEYRRATEHLSILFMSALITASRDRLFGPHPRSPAAAVFECRVVRILRLLRDRCLVAHGSLQRDAIAAWRRSVEATREIGKPRLHSRQVYGLLDRLDVSGEGEALREIWMRYRGRMQGLPDYTWENLEAMGERRGLPPIR